MEKIKVAIAQAIPVYRKALVDKLEDEFNDVVLVVVTSSLQDSLDELLQTPPDVLLFDTRTVMQEGLWALTIVREKFPHIRLLAIRDIDVELNLLESLNISSFIGIHHASYLRQALYATWAGVDFIPPDFDNLPLVRRRPTEATPYHVPKLSHYQRLLVRATSQGQSSVDIAKFVHISSRTIEKHREELYRIFGVKNKEQLIVAAKDCGLI